MVLSVRLPGRRVILAHLPDLLQSAPNHAPTASCRPKTLLTTNSCSRVSNDRRRRAVVENRAVCIPGELQLSVVPDDRPQSGCIESDCGSLSSRLRCYQHAYHHHRPAGGVGGPAALDVREIVAHTLCSA